MKIKNTGRAVAAAVAAGSLALAFTPHAHADTVPGQDTCATQNKAAPSGDCGPFHQIYRETFGKTVPTGAFSQVSGSTFKAAGLLAKNADGDPFTAAASAVWLHATASDALVNANPPGDPSIANTAHAVASLRVALERS